VIGGIGVSDRGEGGRGGVQFVVFGVFGEVHVAIGSSPDQPQDVVQLQGLHDGGR
jgi:hypothetical protein